MKHNRKKQAKVYSAELNNLINFMTSGHKLHGVLVLADDPNQSRASKAWGIFIKAMILTCCICLVIGSISRFSTNDQLQRFACIDCVSIHLLIYFQTLVFWIKQVDVRNLVKWCHWVEMHPQRYCKKPRNWFTATRRNVWKINS